MKKSLFIPALALLGGIFAFGLRLAQNRTGFDPATGLPLSGNLWAMALPLFLVLLALALLLLVRFLPCRAEPDSFPTAFSADRPLELTILVAGVFLLAISGLGELATGMGWTLLPSAVYFPEQAVSSRWSAVAGVLSLSSAAGLFPAVIACRHSGVRELSPAEKRPFNGNLLLLPVVTLVIRLVLTYRMDSVNPALLVYYIELLAQVFLTLAFYRLSSFAFQSGLTRRFAVYASLSCVLCIATLADGHSLPTALFYVSNSLILLAFLLLRLHRCAKPRSAC